MKRSKGSYNTTQITKAIDTITDSMNTAINKMEAYVDGIRKTASIDLELAANIYMDENLTPESRKAIENSVKKQIKQLLRSNSWLKLLKWAKSHGLYLPKQQMHITI